MNIIKTRVNKVELYVVYETSVMYNSGALTSDAHYGLLPVCYMLNLMALDKTIHFWQGQGLLMGGWGR